MDAVSIKYSNYSSNPVAQEIEFELVEDIILKLKYDDAAQIVAICMSDSISENTELEGSLDFNKLNVLIKSLSQLRNQIKAKPIQRREHCHGLESKERY